MARKLGFRFNRKLEVFIKRPLTYILCKTRFFFLLQLEILSFKLYVKLKKRRRKELNQLLFKVRIKK
jgi:hypothetical protein